MYVNLTDIAGFGEVCLLQMNEMVETVYREEIMLNLLMEAGIYDWGWDLSK